MFIISPGGNFINHIGCTRKFQYQILVKRESQLTLNRVNRERLILKLEFSQNKICHLSVKIKKSKIFRKLEEISIYQKIMLHNFKICIT